MQKIRLFSQIIVILVGYQILLYPHKLDALANPENQIIIVENFISAEIGASLIQFYNNEKKDLSERTDNQLLCLENPNIQKIISHISKKILKIMNQSYGLPNKKYQVDHCALYARIPGNFCVYHADNGYFDCPFHGNDQTKLRRTCPGTCFGAKFVQNHTSWREYTALLYLNEDFEGGEILFEDGPCSKLYKKIIPIKANMLIIAPNGQNFYHEVFPIKRGKRYSIHFWYTSDPKHFNPILLTQ